MVECLLWEQDAAGSSPVASTITSRFYANYTVRFFGPVAQLGERSVRIREVESSNLFRSTRLQGLPAKGKILTSVRVFLFPQKHFDSQKRKSCLWSCRYSDASRGFFFWLGIPGVVGTASYVWESLVVMVIALRRASSYTWVNTKGRSKRECLKRKISAQKSPWRSTRR